ncbi:hypothetical protein HNQ57_001107 [Zhongshania antarctica]|jgi:hypothetical protein|uniref:Uncharacterized protein n=1 Tax=Zhongshania antarctica TaxID=641702 RepID=A0A840R2S0_9GAMM|nr:DUF4188 domain-containing protein [Zhongshania antarctica]MBB5186844.1 hypothetical protein [Zhongshania antarctica]
MIEELYRNPGSGLISHEAWFGRAIVMMQYWRSFEQLERYAKSKSSLHLPTWSAFNKKVGSNGDVGIWHETYISRKGMYACVYNNIPKFGLAKVVAHVPAAGKYNAASDWINATVT